MDSPTEIRAPSRLQLGTSRLERVGPGHSVFLDPSWIHLGDPDPGDRPGLLAQVASSWRVYGTVHLLEMGTDWVKNFRFRGSRGDALYTKTNFLPWHYTHGDALPFPDNSFDFVFSEHFFEHLWFDEAVALMEECRRILRPGGVLRTTVPDADLRTDMRPEAVGYPSRKLAFTHPAKHKTRWSIYLLDGALRSVGLEPVWVRYCDKEGVLHAGRPAFPEAYAGCVEQELIDRLDYVMRRGSLIVDGVKPPAR